MKNLVGNINARFKDFIAESFDFVQFSLKKVSVPRTVELLLLRWLNRRQTKKQELIFDIFQYIAKWWIELPNKDSTFRNRSLQVFVRFRSTYVCEAGFFGVQFRNDYRNRMTNTNLENSSLFCLTSYIPRYRELNKTKQWLYPIKHIINFQTALF